MAASSVSCWTMYLWLTQRDRAMFIVVDLDIHRFSGVQYDGRTFLGRKPSIVMTASNNNYRRFRTNYVKFGFVVTLSWFSLMYPIFSFEEEY